MKLKKNLISIITLVLVVTNTILTMLMVFVVVPSMKDSDRIIKKVAQAVNIETGEEKETTDLSKVSLDDCETVDLATKLTIALKKGADGKDHYAVIYPALLVYKKSADYTKNIGTVNDQKAVITQHIQDVVQKYTASELQTNPNAVRDDCLKDLQELLGTDFIVQVVFGTTTIQ